MFGDDIKSLRKMMWEVLQQLRDNKLFLQPEKCQFEKEEMNFLGLTVKQGSIPMDQAKVKSVAAWEVPKNLKEMCSFVQFHNFYQTFILNFSEVMVPLNALTKKDTPFIWTKVEQCAFDQLKKSIIEDGILAIPVEGAPFRLETDASDYAVGAVLHQIVGGQL